MPLYEIPATELKCIVNPLDGKMWKCRPISEEEVQLAIDAGRSEHRIWDVMVNEIPTEEEARQFHIDRIATLFNTHPIEGRITLMLENHLNPVKAAIHDGNHRVAAAYLRKDSVLRIWVAPSVEGTVLNVFPGAVSVSDD